MVLFLEHEGNKRLRSLVAVLYRLTGGRFTPRNRDVLLLTTRGRKSGREHTVLLQSFRDGAKNMVAVAANSSRSSHPDWFHNLKATPTARVEIMDRSLRGGRLLGAHPTPRAQLCPLSEGHRSRHPARAARSPKFAKL
jgi:deazaflavin-dependent oxidoreductase (nitroreductase family)